MKRSNIAMAALLATTILTAPILTASSAVAFGAGSTSSTSGVVSDVAVSPIDAAHQALLQSGVVTAAPAIKHDPQAADDNTPQGPLNVSPAQEAACDRSSAPGEWNSLREYTCAYIAMGEVSLPLADPDKLKAFVDAWNPSKWADSPYLQTQGVTVQERQVRTLALIRRMRDALGNPEPFDYVFSPQRRKNMQTQVVAPQLLGGIGAMLELKDSWQIYDQVEQAILPGSPFHTVQELRSFENQLQSGNPNQLVGPGKPFQTLDDLKAFVKKQQAALQAVLVISPAHPLVINVQPVPDSPATGVLKQGDIIESVNGQSLNGLSLSAAVKLIRGDVGSDVQLQVLRTNSRGKQVSVTFTLVRSTIAEGAVIVQDVDGIRHITITNFENHHLLRDFYQAVVDAQAKGMKGIVLDVRGNPGGNLDYVKAMLEMLVNRGEILMTRQRDPGTSQVIQEQFVMDGQAAITETMVVGAPEESKQFDVKARVPFSTDYEDAANQSPGYVDAHPLQPVINSDMPIAVLADEHSYSASEIFAGGLGGTHRATFVGEPTAGKDDIMSQVGLPELQCDKQGSSLACSRAGLAVISGSFFPGGKNTDRTGVIPDQFVSQVFDNGQTDAQLDAAIAVINAQHAALEQQRAASEKSRKFNSDRFSNEIKGRNANDALPPDQQDPDQQE